MSRNISMRAPVRPEGSVVTSNKFVQAVDYDDSASLEIMDPDVVFGEFSVLDPETACRPGGVMFSVDQLTSERDLVEQSLLASIATGVEYPEEFCLHACERHGSAVVSELCSLFLESVEDTHVNALRVSKQVRKGVHPHARNLVVTMERPVTLALSERDKAQIPLPVLLSILIRYDSENLVNSLVECDPNYIIAAFAMAGVPPESLFVNNLNSAFFLPLETFPGLTIEKYNDLLSRAYEMYDLESDVIDINNELMHSLGVSGRIPLTKEEWRLAISPQLIFPSVYVTAHGKGVSDSALASLHKSKQGGNWWSTDALTAYGKVYATRPGVEGKRSVYSLLRELKVIIKQ